MADISKLAQAANKTQSQLVAEVGCSQTYMSLILCGKRNVGLRYLDALASALGVTPAEVRPDLAHMFSPSSVAPSSEAAQPEASCLHEKRRNAANGVQGSGNPDLAGGAV